MGVEPARAAAVALSASVSGGAFDDDFFPQVGKAVECLPACTRQASRSNAAPASIVTTEIEGHQNYGDASMRADVHGRARIGDLGLSISGFAGGGARSSAGTVDVSARSSWSDRITITTNAVPLGERIVMEATMNLFAVLDAIASGEQGLAGVVLILSDLGGPSLLPSSHGGLVFGRQIHDLADDVFIDEQTDDVVHVQLSLFNGLPMAIGYAMDLQASARSFGDRGTVNNALPGSGSFDGIAINSLHWGGIQRVSDRLGNVIDSFSVASDSGFDFARPFSNGVPDPSVPEPSALALALAALGAGWACRRRPRVNRGRLAAAPA